MKWMLENVEAVRVAAGSGDAMFGTVDSWLIFNLTGGVDGGVHVTDGALLLCFFNPTQCCAHRTHVVGLPRVQPTFLSSHPKFDDIMSLL